jgi:choloylglycine hydrolase
VCTSLLYRDAANRAYLGRTLELSLQLPYRIALFPVGLELASRLPGHPAVSWQMRRAVVAVTMPAVAPGPDKVLGAGEIKLIEGLNDAGLTFSVQSYPHAGGLQAPVEAERAVLSAADLGTWVLGQFSTVAETQAALADQPVLLESIPILGGLEMPFHYVVHDPTGASLVIEFHHGTRTLYDNPVGAMTNAPQFSWHLTNLDNYTFLSNVDRSQATFGAYRAVQPGAGISKAGLPASDTSVDRFVRAVFYAQFAEKQTDPDQAVQMVAHLMNNFDRPRGIAVDYPDCGSGHLQVEGQETSTAPTEFTSWTSLSDLDRRLFFLRDSDGMSYSRFDLKVLSSARAFKVRPMSTLMPAIQDVTASLMAD